MKQIKLFFVIDSLYGGGAEKMVIDLATSLDKNKYKVFLCSLSKYHGSLKYFKKNDINIFILNKNQGFDMSVIFKIYKILKQEKIDIIHTHLFSSNFYGRIAAILARIPLIIINEHSLGSCMKLGRHIFIDKILSLFTDKIVAVSYAVKYDCIYKQKLPVEKLVTIYNGVDLRKFNQYDCIRSTNSKRFVIGYFGRFVPIKNLFFLLDAVAKFNEKKFNIKLLLIGAGPLKCLLKNYAKKKKILSNVLFKPWQTNISRYYQFIDIFVLPSFREGLPLSVLEAMASAKPVVLTDVGGNSEVILDGETGYLFPVSDSLKFHKILVKLMNNVKLRKKLGRNGRKRVKSFFTIESMTENYELLYDKLYSNLKK